MGSGAGTASVALHDAYGSNKAGRGLSRIAAREWGPHGITVNVINPYVASAVRALLLATLSAPSSSALALDNAHRVSEVHAETPAPVREKRSSRRHSPRRAGVVRSGYRVFDSRRARSREESSSTRIWPRRGDRSVELEVVETEHCAHAV